MKLNRRYLRQILICACPWPSGGRGNRLCELAKREPLTPRATPFTCLWLSRVELKSRYFRLPLQRLSFRLQRRLYVHLQHLKQAQWHNIIHERQHGGFFLLLKRKCLIFRVCAPREDTTQRQVCVSTRCHQQQSREKVDEFIVHTLSPRDTELCRQGYVASS